MLGRPVASELIYVRPVGSPETPEIKWKVLIEIIWCEPLDPHLTAPLIFILKLFMAQFGSEQTRQCHSSRVKLRPNRSPMLRNAAVASRR